MWHSEPPTSPSLRQKRGDERKEKKTLKKSFIKRMLSGNKDPLSALSSEMKMVSIMRKINTPAHFSKCQRTYINTNKARSMKEIPEQLSVTATIKKTLLPHSVRQHSNYISRAISKCHGFAFFFITAMLLFFLFWASLCISNCWFPYRLPQRAEGLYTPDVSLPLFYVHVSLEPEGQCKANVAFIPCWRCEEM